MFKLEGRVAVVTGGGRGIGRCIAELLAAEGAKIAVVDRDGEAAECIADSISRTNAIAIPVRADVSREDDVRSMTATVMSTFSHVDVLINNAGYPKYHRVIDMTLEEWEEIIAVNLTGTFLCTRAVLPKMVERRFGRIINIASQLGLIGASEMAHYSAAKAGVIGLTKALAREVAEFGITVNAVAPGPIETDNLASTPRSKRDALLREIPIARFGRVEEVASTVLLLASDSGAYYTGAVMNVSGGHAM
jgi:3-oxoacyl-[acyl-carrier protein] reductase